MKIQNPLTSLSNRKGIFLLMFIGTILLLVLLNIIGLSLETEAAPLGIISYEFAGTVEKASEIIDSWDQNAQLHAAFSLGLDFLFLILYSTTIGLACVWAGKVLIKGRWPLVGVAVPLAWGLWLAAILDAVENFCLITILYGPIVSPWPEVARISAMIKFGLVFIGLIYAFYGLVGHLANRYMS